MWKRAIYYGFFLAAGTLALQWLDYQRLARAHSNDIYILLVATAFLALGIFVGVRAFRGAPPKPFDGNPKAQQSLGMSPRELTVLLELAEHGEDARGAPVRKTGRQPAHRGHPQGARPGNRALT